MHNIVKRDSSTENAVLLCFYREIWQKNILIYVLLDIRVDM